MKNPATVLRTGEINVKASKMDPVYQWFLVREWSDGTREIWHNQLFRWVEFPPSWNRRHIYWETE